MTLHLLILDLKMVFRMFPKKSRSFLTPRRLGALGHMFLSGTEGYYSLFKKTSEFILNIIGEPNEPNPDYDNTIGVDVSIS